MGSPPESKLDLLNLVFLKPQTTSVHLICCTYFYVSYLEFFLRVLLIHQASFLSWTEVYNMTIHRPELLELWLGEPRQPLLFSVNMSHVIFDHTASLTGLHFCRAANITFIAVQPECGPQQHHCVSAHIHVVYEGELGRKMAVAIPAADAQQKWRRCIRKMMLLTSNIVSSSSSPF